MHKKKRRIYWLVDANEELLAALRMMIARHEWLPNHFSH
jgi:hypothetical protein